MYEVGEVVEVATVMLTFEIPWRTKVMTITKKYDIGTRFMYSCDNDDYVHYSESRILRRI